MNQFDPIANAWRRTCLVWGVIGIILGSIFVASIHQITELNNINACAKLNNVYSCTKIYFPSKPEVTP